MKSQPSIWPRVRAAHVEEAPVRYPARVRLDAGCELPAGFADLLRARLAAVGVETVSGSTEKATPLLLRRVATTGTARSDEAYTIHLGRAEITVGCATPCALYPASATLVQHLRGLERSDDVLHGQVTSYHDHPDFAVRGVMLDVSRTRVPQMESLFELVERLSLWKINQLQLYLEHTFAYAGHEEVWRDASPFTPDEIRALDRFCAVRGIELVPNQQSFGHMHRWLKHARYRGLAEVPEGVDHAFSIEREPYSLDLSDPRALALLDDLYDQLLPCFTSRLVNVGLDETFDLGLGRARESCAERGVERVYLEYLHRIHEKIGARGRRLQFWGDIIVKRPDLVRELPRDAIALEWGYDAGHPFAEHGAAFASSGLEFYVCPGTSSWQSLGGRTANMLANLSEAARHGRTAGARGYLVTDWGDRGHLQPRVIAEAGLAIGAACAWNTETDTTHTPFLAHVLDRHVFDDPAGVLGELLLELGRAGHVSGATSTNGSPLFFLLAFARETFPPARVVGATAAGCARAREFLADLRARLPSARSQRPDAALLSDELRLMIDLLMFACDFGAARLALGPGTHASALPAVVRANLAQRLRPGIAEHRRVWLRRDRPGGLDESVGWLERVLAELDPAARDSPARHA